MLRHRLRDELFLIVRREITMWRRKIHPLAFKLANERP